MYTRSSATIRNKYIVNDTHDRLKAYSKSKRSRKRRKRSKRRSHHSKRNKIKIPLSNNAPYYNSFKTDKSETTHKMQKELIYTNNTYQILPKHHCHKTHNENIDSIISNRVFSAITFEKAYNFYNCYIDYDINMYWKPSFFFEWLLITCPASTTKEIKWSQNDIEAVEKCVNELDNHSIYDTLNKPTYNETIHKMKELLQVCSKNKCVPTIYYSGHGAENTGNWNFENNEIKLIDILRIFSAKNNDCLMLIIDACFSGAFIRDIEKKDDIALNDMLKKYKNLIIFASSEHNEESYWCRSFTSWAFKNGKMPYTASHVFFNGKILNGILMNELFAKLCLKLVSVISDT